MRPKLLVFDFDGVLTDNRVMVFDDGHEAVLCNRSDGLAFDMFRLEKIPALIMSTETNAVVSNRAAKLQVEVLQGLTDKASVLQSYCVQHNIDLEDVLFVGNDLNDWSVMKQVGLPVCPCDAHPEIKAISRIVLRTSGGHGVAREVAEVVLKLIFNRPTAAPSTE